MKPSSPRAAPHFRLIALIVASALFMTTLDGAIINTSLPQMAHAFAVPPVRMSIGVTAYLLSVAVFVPLSGWLADRWGARNVYAAAIVVFVLASLGCGLSTSLNQFAVARAFQGLGGALMLPVGRLVILRHTAKAQLMEAMALVTWPGLMAPVLGPALGGFITTYVGWRWNFLLNVPVGLVGLTLVALFIPNSRDQRGPLDVPGFLLTAVALVGVLFGLESLAHGDLSRPVSGLVVAAGLGAGALAVRHFGRTPHPLLELSPMKVRTFAVSVWGEGLAYRTALHATPFLLPLMFQLGFGRNAWQAGLLILAYFAGNLAMKSATTPILRRWGFRTVLVGNGLAGGLAILACALLTAGAPTALTVAILFIAGLTRSMQFTALNTMNFADITPAQQTSAATLNSMCNEASMATGVAFGAILLSLTLALHGSRVLALADFRLALLIVAAVAIGSALLFLRLKADAGAEISGHRDR